MTRRPDAYPSPTGKCLGCGKDCYRSRKGARAAARHHHPGDHQRAYECTRAPTDGVWHYGHVEKMPPQPSGVPVAPAPLQARAAMALIARASPPV